MWDTCRRISGVRRTGRGETRGASGHEGMRVEPHQAGAVGRGIAARTQQVDVAVVREDRGPGGALVEIVLPTAGCPSMITSVRPPLPVATFRYR